MLGAQGAVGGARGARRVHPGGSACSIDSCKRLDGSATQVHSGVSRASQRLRQPRWEVALFVDTVKVDLFKLHMSEGQSPTHAVSVMIK